MVHALRRARFLDTSPRVSMIPKGRFLDLPGANVSRYLWAAEHLKGRKVIDYGCGHGYGAYFLSDGIANYVMGIDPDSKAIKFAQEHYKRGNLEFLPLREGLNIPESDFDAVVSFEVIEHIHDPRDYLARISKILILGGDFFLSTPNKFWSEQFYNSGMPLNLFHVTEYYPAQLEELLHDYFDTIGCFVRFTAGNYDQYRLQWSRYMSTCPIPMSLQRNSPTMVKHAIRATYSRFIQLLGHPPPSELEGKYYLNRIEPVQSAEDILKYYPEQLWWVRKKQP
jgi:SAM-dependent methyltransferase